MPTATTTAQEIAQLQKRLAQLQEQAEDELRQRLKEARQVVTDLEMQLSEITGRPFDAESSAWRMDLVLMIFLGEISPTILRATILL